MVYTNATFVVSCLGGSTGLGGYPLQVADYHAKNGKTQKALEVYHR